MVLHLTLYREWFDAIASGRKKIEYRKVKPYWRTRLEGKSFSEVYFRNGYQTDAPSMRVRVKRIIKSRGFYEIHLGRILSMD